MGRMEKITGTERLTAALADLAGGKPVILTGASDGGPVMLVPGRDVTAAQVNRLTHEARGLVGIALPLRRAAELGLSLQPRRNCRRNLPLYTLSIEAVGVGTGISAGERAETIRAAADPAARAGAVVSPGHIFPQVVEPGLHGQAEGAVTLLRLAGCGDVAAICSMIGPDGGDLDTAAARVRAAALGLTAVDMADLPLTRSGG